MLHCTPYVINRHCLHAGAVSTGLHLSQEKAGLATRMPPDGYVFRIIEWIGTILLRAGRAKDGNDRDIDGCC